jgi:hypothetical protein
MNERSHGDCWLDSRRGVLSYTEWRVTLPGGGRWLAGDAVSGTGAGVGTALHSI